MKSIIKSIFFLGMLLTMNSCLEQGLDELPTFEEANITNMSFEYRWDNAGVYDKVNLDNSIVVDENAGTVQNAVTIPSNVDPTVASSISLSNLVGIVDISPAATITPASGAPLLGAPGDFSGSAGYTVTAADGTTKNWTITTTLN